MVSSRSYRPGKPKRLRRTRRRADPWRNTRRGRRFSLALPPDLVALVIAGLVIGGLLFVYIRQGTLLRTLTAERETAREELTEREEINRVLEIAIDQGFSLQQLSWKAGKLGMVVPEKVYHVYVPASVRP